MPLPKQKTQTTSKTSGLNGRTENGKTADASPAYEQFGNAAIFLTRSEVSTYDDDTKNAR